jgi:iron complex transport system substrate-binding protein
VSFESSFGEEKGLSRDALGELGIATHVLYETCIPRPSTWEGIYGEIGTLGAIFDAGDRAAEVVARMQGEVAQAEATAAELPASPRVFVYDSGEAAPFTAGGAGIENLMITTAGGTNIFADIDKSFGEATWEEVVARDPEIIVINDYQDDTHASPPLEQKIAAIVNDRIVPVSLHHVFLSVRNSDATAALAEAFASALSR